MEGKMDREGSLTFLEAASIIVGHGVGVGILAVPYLASRNSWLHIIIICAVCYLINLLMHYMIAELSYNNKGAQFIKCFKNELFTGKIGKPLTWADFFFLGLSVLVNVAGYIAGSAAVINSWFGLDSRLGMLIYYAVVSLVVLYGLKMVGIFEKISVISMVGVVGILFVSAMIHSKSGFANEFIDIKNVAALYSMVMFSLSAVMSVPQVVKGLGGDIKKIKSSIAVGTGVNLFLIILITVMTIIGTGGNVSESGALVDLSQSIGGWVGIVGYVFSLLALSTSFWANTLNLRDIVYEQTGLKRRLSYLVCSIPSLILALLGLQSFVGFTRLAGVIQVLTGIGIILAYRNSRKKASLSPICGKFGTAPFRILVIVSSLLATVGSLVKVV
ncbi:MAG: aromatic amino acid transport family protein [Oscillospiraceae bacterium]|jgi:amino acid permease